jgi:hypothetical protein
LAINLLKNRQIFQVKRVLKDVYYKLNQNRGFMNSIDSHSDRGLCHAPLCEKKGQYKCTDCFLAIYCGPKCLLRDWETHKFKCTKAHDKSFKSIKGEKIQNSSLALKEAKRYLGENQLEEANRFMILMTKEDKKVFLKAFEERKTS